MARALLPASFVREAPTNNQSGVPVTATRHCLVPVLPRRAKTSFPGREAAPLRFAAPAAWVQRGSWAGLRSASASAVTLCWRGATPPSWLARPPQQRHCPPTHATGREAGPATRATGLRRPFLKTKTQEESAETRCRRCRSYCVLASSPALGPEPARHPHRGSPQRSWAHAVDELIQQEEEDPVGRLLHSLLPTASALTALTPATLSPTDS